MQHEAVASLCHHTMLRQGLLVPEETMANAALQPSAIEFPMIATGSSWFDEGRGRAHGGIATPLQRRSQHRTVEECRPYSWQLALTMLKRRPNHRVEACGPVEGHRKGR